MSAAGSKYTRLVLTELGLYKLLGENPERTWPVARELVIPIAKLIVPSWGYGHERIPVEGAAVVASNHFSEVDPAVVGLHSTRALYYMAKIELVSIPIVGEILRWTGAYAVRRGESDRDALRVARWSVQQGHVAGIFAEGTRQLLGYPGPMHPGAAMLAIQEGVPLVPCGIDTFGWSLKNRRMCCAVWGEPIALDLPRTGKGYKEGAVVMERAITALWRQAARAVADGFPETLPGGLRRRRELGARDMYAYPRLEPWPDDEWAAGPLGPVYPGR
jgi:1-acyl-sn-glycerol-3-phosphate acyltransferase